MKRPMRWILVAALLSGCSSEATNGGEPTAVISAETAPAPTDAAPVRDPAPTLDAIPKLRRDVVEAKAGDDLAVVTRLLTRSLGSSDGVRLMLSFTPMGAAEAPLSKETVDWAKTLAQLEVKVKAPDGTTVVRKVSGSIAAPSGSWALGQSPARHLDLGPQGIMDRTAKWSLPWADAGDWLKAPGRYELTLAGELALASGPRSFSSAPIGVDVKEGLRPIVELEELAGGFARDQLGLRARPEPSKPSLEDEADNLVVRFFVTDRRDPYKKRFVETILERNGKLLSLRSIEIFTCVARGTAIATPDGPRGVEELAVGDAVIAFDVDSGRSSVTRVEAIVASHGEPLFEVTPGLRLTGRHPVHADGRWVEAEALAGGSELMTLDAQPVVASPRRIDGGDTVYDLSVGWPHTYFAGGVLVHNKIAESPGARSIREDLDARPEPRR